MVGFNTIQNGAAGASNAVIGNSVQSLAASTIAQNSRLGTTDIAGINAAIDQIAATDPALANALRTEIAGSLSTVEQGQLAANYGTLNQGGNLLAANPGSVARGLTAAQKSLALDVTQLGLDIVGIFEPTPFADGANTLISLGRGDWFGAITSAAGIIPYVGDAAKLGKLGKWAETVAKAVDMAATNPAFRKAIEPALRKIVDAIDSVGLSRLPDSVRGPLSAIKSKIDNLLGTQARNVQVVTRHAAGNQQVLIDGQRWNIPAGKSASDVPRIDPVGNRLQELATDAASRWSPARMSANERRAISEARSAGEHWRANLLQQQAKGRWVEDQVRNAASAERLPLQWSRQGLDATDLRNGTKYDVMSGTKSNLDTHAKREPNQLFRMITF
jgi:hypothetical protein